MKIIWSLGNMVGNDASHSDFVYDMFYLSMALSKDLGYQNCFYGTHDSVNKIRPFVSECYDVTWLDYKLYDDIKVNIWYERNDEFFTMDGDVFLYSRLDYDEYLGKVGIKNKPIQFIYEKIQKATPQALSALNSFNKFNPKQIIPEWDFNNTLSYSTGLIGWVKNSQFKKYYCESYAKLRNWFLENEEEMKKTNGYLNRNSSVSSHIICEHLLYQLANYYNITSCQLTQNSSNSFWHVQGPNKFLDKNFIHDISQFVKIHKSSNYKVEFLHKQLLENKTLSGPLLFKEKFILI